MKNSVKEGDISIKIIGFLLHIVVKDPTSALLPFRTQSVTIEYM
ncbi:hypothetical protein VCRA2120E57_40085 [Vibrio crassostreae]|nr:hypothetical protein VCRA2120E57_40085 [Vibrio crassostreae]